MTAAGAPEKLPERTPVEPLKLFPSGSRVRLCLVEASRGEVGGVPHQVVKILVAVLYVCKYKSQNH